MPAPLAVDWHEVKTLAIAIGVREAARQMGLSEEAVKKRCTREGWLKPLQEAESQLVQSRQTIAEHQQIRNVPAVPSAAEVLKRMGEETRSKLAVGLNKAATTVSEMDGPEVLMSAQQVQQLAKSAQVVHGWANTVEHKVRLDMMEAMDGVALPALDAEFEQLTDGDD